MEQGTKKVSMSLDPVRVRFRDPTVEAAFSASWLKAIWLVRVLWVSVAAVVFAFYSLLIVFASDQSLAEMHWFRIFVCVPMLAVVVWTLVAKIFTASQIDVIFPLASTFVFANASYGYANSTGPESQLYLYEMAMLFVFSMSYFPGLFRPILVALTVNTVISYITFWHVWLTAGQSWATISVQTMLLMGLAFTGLFVAYSKDLLIRTNYRALQVAKAEKRQAEQLAHAAHAASEAKSRFVAMVGHEFRTPLNAILGYSEIMQMQHSAQTRAPRMGEYLQDIHDSAKHLHRLVENVLSIASGPEQVLALTPEEVELMGAASKALALCRDTAQQAKVDCRLAAAAERKTIRADSWMVSHMIDELLSNAIKFSPPSSDVVLDIQPTSDGGARIVVSDNGIGMDDETRKKVLEPFFQKDDTLSRRQDGLGLGLTLVARMMDAHGGQVSIASDPGIGSTVTLTFPSGHDRTDADPLT